MTERLVIFRADRKRYVDRVKGEGKVEVIAGPQSAYAYFGREGAGRTVYVHLSRLGKFEVRSEGCEVAVVSDSSILPSNPLGKG